MSPLILVGGLLALAGGAYALATQGPSDSSEMETEVVSDKNSRLYSLPDIDLDNAFDVFKDDYNIYFESAADATGVPAALLKAAGVQESSLKAGAFLDENPANRSDRQGWASRGLLQLLWWPGSERWAKYGYSDASLGMDAIMLYDPGVNAMLGAKLYRDNLKACGGNLRDAINMYNTGKKEAAYPAPGDYVNRIISNYETILGESVS